MFFCYILQSLKSGSYYIGATENLEVRVVLHNAGKVLSTKKGVPWQLVYHEQFPYLRDARKRELQIKNWKSRAAIERLLKTFTI